MIISSGNGLHCYWPLTQSISPDEWKTLAVSFKAVLSRFGVLADPSRTADAASILRPVISTNKKDPTNPKPVKVLRDAPAVDVSVIIAALSNIVCNHDVDVVGPVLAHRSEVNDDLTAHAYPDTPAYVDLIVSKCKQAQVFKETGFQANEPAWKAMIGALFGCVDGLEKNSRTQ